MLKTKGGWRPGSFRRLTRRSQKKHKKSKGKNQKKSKKIKNTQKKSSKNKHSIL